MKEFNKIYDEIIKSHNKQSIIKESVGNIVYVLTHFKFHGEPGKILGIFDSKEKAIELQSQLIANPHTEEDGEVTEFKDYDFEITEHEINKVELY